MKMSSVFEALRFTIIVLINDRLPSSHTSASIMLQSKERCWAFARETQVYFLLLEHFYC